MGRAVQNLLLTSITWVAIVIAATFILRVRLVYAIGTMVLGFGTIVMDCIRNLFTRKTA